VAAHQCVAADADGEAVRCFLEASVENEHVDARPQ
jgi:hypothetical protein